MIVTTHYQQNYVRDTVKYACKCGHKFTRVNSDWFTLNPLHNKTFEECTAEYHKKNKERVRDCPKCKQKVKPVKK